MLIRTIAILLCVCSFALGQNAKRLTIPHESSNRPADSPRSTWEAARDAFMASRFPSLFGLPPDTGRFTPLLDTTHINSSTATVHHLNFGSSANTIELAVSGSGETQVLDVESQGVPDWLSLIPARQKLILGKTATVRFTLAVKRTAPVNKETTISFLLQSAGQQWIKDIAVLVEPPKTFELFQNFPNPFNPTTVISYQLPMGSRVKLKVYNLLGQEITTLIDQEEPVGYHEATFDANRYSSGMYVYRMTALGPDGEHHVLQHRMLLLK